MIAIAILVFCLVNVAGGEVFEILVKAKGNTPHDLVDPDKIAYFHVQQRNETIFPNGTVEIHGELTIPFDADQIPLWEFVSNNTEELSDVIPQNATLYFFAKELGYHGKTDLDGLGISMFFN